MYEWHRGWAGAGIDAWLLGMEASAVIGLRMAKIDAGGPGAHAEAWRMLSEKVQAAYELQTAMVAGGLGATPLATTRRTLNLYRRKVKANRKRLA